jgi:hypothetical protein
MRIRIIDAITLDFPAAPVIAVAPPDGLAEALGVSPPATFSAGAFGDLIALHDDEAAAAPSLRTSARSPVSPAATASAAPS